MEIIQIHAYTRKQAIEDGVLVDVSKMAREAGFRFPVAVTRELYDQYIVPSEYDKEKWAQSTDGRLWDVLMMLLFAIKGGRGGSTLYFDVIFRMHGRKRKITLKGVCHPGDYGEPVITIMLPHED